MISFEDELRAILERKLDEQKAEIKKQAELEHYNTASKHVNIANTLDDVIVEIIKLSKKRAQDE